MSDGIYWIVTLALFGMIVVGIVGVVQTRWAASDCIKPYSVTSEVK